MGYFLQTFLLLSAICSFLNYEVQQSHEGASLFIQSSCILCYLYVCVVCTYVGTFILRQSTIGFYILTTVFFL